MRKTKLFALVLAMLMVLTIFAGCGTEKIGDNDVTDNSSVTQSGTEDNNGGSGNSSETDTNTGTSNKKYITSKKAFTDKVAELIDLSLYEDLDETDETSYKSYYYELDSDNEKDYDLDYKIKLGDGSEFTMPISFSELEEKGWALPENADPDFEIDSGHVASSTVSNSEGKEFTFYVYNRTDNKITLKEGLVTSVCLYQYDSYDLTEKLSEAIDFTVCGTLNNASTLEDIIEKLGNPYSINCALNYDDDGNYTYSEIEVDYTQESSSYSSLVFTLSGDGNYITNVDYSVDPE